MSRQQGPPSRRGASERPRPGRERTWPILGGADAPGRSGDLRGGHRRRALKVGYSWSARTLDAGMGRPGGPWELGYSRRRQIWARHPPGAVLAGRLGPLGPSPSGAGLGDLTNERPFARPRPAPPPEPRPRRVPNRPAPWPGAVRAPKLRLVSAQPPRVSARIPPPVRALELWTAGPGAGE